MWLSGIKTELGEVSIKTNQMIKKFDMFALLMHCSVA